VEFGRLRLGGELEAQHAVVDLQRMERFQQHQVAAGAGWVTSRQGAVEAVCAVITLDVTPCIATSKGTVCIKTGAVHVP
jgi:hypothetical protein